MAEHLGSHPLLQLLDVYLVFTLVITCLGPRELPDLEVDDQVEE